MPGPVRTRAACDRCHSQKLRCHKDAGSITCARCTRAGAACVFSPPGRPGAAAAAAPARSENAADPPPAAAITPDHLPSGGPDELAAGGLEWPFMYDGLSLDDLMKIPTPSSSGESQLGVSVRDDVPETLLRPATTGGPAAATAAAELTMSQRLTRLMEDADSVVASLPPCSALHMPSDASHQMGADFASKFLHDNYMAQMFNVIQRLVDEYPELIKLLQKPPDNADESCEEPDCLHRVELPPPFAWLAAAVPRRVDVASVNLLISGHFRLLDALDRTFTCAATCFRATLASPTLTEPEFILSPIQIGSFVPSKGSSAMMQLFLLKHLLSILFNRTQQLMDFLKGADFEEREAQCLTLQLELLRDRHTGITAHLTSFETAAVQLGMMK